ncbi:MAG: DNA polymerase III subunit gamma/tau [Acidobacteria bacterium]|nr:DNA polymerase III subunit gamma/tau [Acidobacteriota bacterium]
MSYQVIARKWRPQAFDEVTGQEHVTQTLRNAIEHDRLHHAYLFSGARGVGKTTSARLLAKALNCHKAEKPTAFPCKTTDADQCPSCLEISESRSIDVLEFDAASNTQVDKIRDIILDGINVKPARDRNKIFIIDEVHMLSTSSFNALLKTLEEPPPNVVFIMATTELHKVPETITSRCQEFLFRTISRQKIFDRLRLIADAEGVKITDAALNEVARSGEGSMRDAQSNFDQVISFSGEAIDVQDVINALGMTSSDTLIAVVRSLIDNEPKASLKIVDEMVATGRDLRNFCRDLLSLIRDLTVYKVAGDDDELLGSAAVSKADLAALAEPLSGSDLVRFFNSIAETESKLKDSTQPRITLELGLVKMAEMRRLVAVEQLLERLNALTGGEQSPVKTEAAVRSAAPAIAEKKTLNSEPPPRPADPDPPKPKKDLPPPERPLPEPPEEPSLPEPPPWEDRPPWEDAPPVEEPPPSDQPPAVDLSFVGDLPSKLPQRSAAELEHYEDARLDDAYEEKLEQNGETNTQIPGIQQIVRSLLAERPSERVIDAEARARDLAAFAPPVFDDEGPAEPIILPPDPTPEQLAEYARSLPEVRKVLRLFRAEIVEVKKSAPRNFSI